MPDLLIELRSEEIPARMQSRAADDLRRLVTDGVVEAGLTYAHAVAFATPRRLCLALEGLTERSPTMREARRGPREGAPDKAVEGFARGAGVAREALVLREEGKGRFWFADVVSEGRAAAAIVAEVLERTIRGFPWPKSMRWGAGELRWVRPLQSIICLLTREDGAEVVPVEIDGLRAGDETWGHRFMAPGAIRVGGFEDYAAKLKRAHVVLDAAERMERIRADAESLAFAAGAELVPDEGLLREVAGLVEWPVALMGRIDERFLRLPPEVLQTSMREHQKFLAVRDREGRIARFVAVANRETANDGALILAGNARVLSARLADAAFFWENDLAVARAGMEAWLEKLQAVTFHAKLGSQAERIERIAALARELAPAVGADPDEAGRAARLAKADLASEMVYEFPELQGVMGRYYALEAGEPQAVADAVCDHYAPLGPSDEVPTAPVSVAVALADKLDLLTGMWAIGETPTGSKDPFALRRAALGVIRIVLASKQRLPLLETAVTPALGLQLFSVMKRANEADNFLRNFLRNWDLDDNRPPVGRSDLNWGILFEGKERWPDDLIYRVFFYPAHDLSPDGEVERRQTYEELKERVEHWNGVFELPPGTRTMGEQFLFDQRINFVNQMWRVEKRRPAWVPFVSLHAPNLLAFLHDRLKVHLRDEGIRHDVIDACLAAPKSDDLALLTARARALDAFLRSPDGRNLLGGYRRAANILAQAEARDGVEYSFGADPALARDPEERALFDALAAARPRIEAALGAEDFTAAMEGLASLRAPIDAFFEAVQVNAEAEVVRRNRLNLLHEITSACGRVADLGRIEG